jgi:phage gp29-like protein
MKLFGINISRVKNANIATTNMSKHSLAQHIAPVQLERVRQDVSTWRDSMREAEQAWFPYRVKQQRLYLDTNLNGHVLSVKERRKDLTLLRDFKLCDASGNESDEMKALFQQEWFYDLVSYALDAVWYGYSLIALGDIKDGVFADSSVIKRWHVSPEREELTKFIYHTTGISFTEGDAANWHLWVKTPSDTGIGNCGYGLFNSIALYEIILRNTLGFNADFVELFSQPYRVGKTTKTDETERAELELALQTMGSSSYAIIDPTDDIQFIESKLSGTGWQSYDNLDKRCMKMISKIGLGHADALDSIPGKLGAGSGEDNPVYGALKDKQSKDGRFIQNIVNGQLIPKMRALGFHIPEGYRFEYRNDEEKEAFRRRQDESNKATADIALSMKKAGLQMSSKYFEERTGIPTDEANG